MKTPVLLNVLDIYLDDENPRHEPITDQNKIFSYLVKDELVKPLAKDIAEQGLSPIDLPAVIQDEKGRYIALEGNRRLCATKLLHDPSRAPSDSKNYFKKLAKEATAIPLQVRCIVFDGREEADVWLDRRHNGQQGGIGVKDWDAEQKSRRNQRHNKTDQNTLAQSILDYAREQGFLETIQKRIVTTAARYLGNPYFRTSAGIVSSRSEAKVVINVAHLDFEKFLKVFCVDLVKGERVSSRSKKTQWEEYARTLMAEGAITSKIVTDRYLGDRVQYVQPGSNKGAVESTEQNTGATESSTNNSAIDNSNTSTGSTQVEEKGGSSGKGTQNPDKRKYVVPSNFRPRIENKILRRTFQELATLPVDEMTLAASLITRVFLEKTYHLFYEAVQGNYLTNVKTHVVVEKVIALIEPDSSLTKSEKGALAALRALSSNKSHALSPHTLGAHAHATYYPDAIQLRREFDNISPIIEYMLNRI
jgi:hypothetical protein